MICEAFEQLVTAIEDEQAFAEASARHVAACPHCAVRLVAEARVAQSLRALADADQHREAPAHVEVMARAVWRGTAAARASAMPTPMPVRTATTWWRPAAAAAVIAVAVAPLMVAMWSRVAGTTGPAGRHAEAIPTPPQVEASAPRVPNERPTEPSGGAMRVADRAQPPRPIELTARASSRMPARAVRRATMTGSRAATAAPSPVASRVRAETLAFVPFPYAEPLRPTEVRQIVRVAVPQATLLMAGLTTATPADSVVADVLVGEDGIARGIRIVR